MRLVRPVSACFAGLNICPCIIVSFCPMSECHALSAIAALLSPSSCVELFITTALTYDGFFVVFGMAAVLSSFTGGAVSGLVAGYVWGRASAPSCLTAISFAVLGTYVVCGHVNVAWFSFFGSSSKIVGRTTCPDDLRTWLSRRCHQGSTTPGLVQKPGRWYDVPT